jgi:hypothetical protein
VDDVTIYLATSPDRATDGRFLSENVRDLDFLTDEEIQAGFWSYETQLAPGIYHVMLGADDYDCGVEATCIDGYSNVLTLVIPLPTLSMRDARGIIREALTEDFGFQYANRQRINRCRRLSRLRISCRRVRWAIGDSSFRGSVTARRVLANERIGWRVKGMIRQTDQYCAATGGRRCTKRHRVNERGVD